MSYKYFENKSCEYYPCHKAEHINCLFCFCPLYTDWGCGGNFIIIKGKNGEDIKDCSNCIFPHSENGYDYVIEKLSKK